MKNLLKIVLFVILLYYLYHGWFKYYFKKSFDEEKLIPMENYYSDTTSNDLVKIIDDETEGYQIRLKLLDTAKDSLVISYYDIGNDYLGNDFLAKALEAARRGVRVNLLVDHLATGNKKGLEALATHPNCTIKYYNKLNFLDPKTYHERLHDKYIVVDNEYLLLGGRNIGVKYLNDEETTKDRDVLVKRENRLKPSVIDDVLEYNKQIFDYQYSSLVTGDTDVTYLSKLIGDLDKYKYKEYDLDLGLMKTNKITLLTNPIIRDRKEPTLLNNLINIANSSKKYLMIQSPYFVMDKNMYKLFDTKAKKYIVTNSVYSTPNLPAFSTYLYSKHKILDKDVTIFEYNKADSIHQKAMLVDDRLTVVGSFNIDPRSAYIDTEMMLVIDSVDVRDKFEEQNNKYYMNDMVMYQPDGGILGHPLEAKLTKRIMFKVGGIFFSAFKSLL